MSQSTTTEQFAPPVAHLLGNGLAIAGLQLADGNGAPLLHIEHWAMPAGVHWVHGASGSGKSRLLQCLASAGSPGIDWHSAAAMPRPLGPEEVFLADAEHAQWDALTAPEVHARLLASNVHGACRLSAESQARCHADLQEGFGLAAHWHKAMYMLSTGTRRKVFLMAALLAPHPLVLLDEPCAALDRRSIQTLYYALALRNRIAQQVTLVATAMEPQDHGQIGRGHWHLEPA